MRSFVDRAFGDDPVQQVGSLAGRAESKSEAEDARAAPSVVDCGHTIPMETDNELTGAFCTQARRGGDPSAERSAARQAPIMKELCARFLSGYSVPRNKPSTVKGNRVRAAAETVSARRRSLIGGSPLSQPPAKPEPVPPPLLPEPVAVTVTGPPPGLEDRTYASRTKLGNYRPYRKRSGPNRTPPPKRTASTTREADNV